jgi:DegV family protein with EDD domain
VTVRIVCDSAAALDSELVALHRIAMVPMELSIAGERISEEELTPDQVVARLEDGVQTSGPAPGAFAEAIAAVAGPDGVVVLTVASRFSSTFQAARAAAALIGDGVPVRVVDTGTAAGGEGLVVLAAAEAARAGAGLDQVVARAELAGSRVRLVAAVDRLTYLVRGGRVQASAARLGNRLGVRVLFELRRSGPRPLRPVVGAEAAFEQLLSQWRRTIVPDAELHVAALHALRPEEGAALLDAIGREIKPATALVCELGPVMLAHTGPGVVGLSWWWDDPRPAAGQLP